MDRLHFIRLLKLSVLSIPFSSKFLSDPIENSSSLTKYNLSAFPDKENHLIAATCIFATPGWGDGKNGDDSFVRAVVDIECYDNLYSGSGALLNNTEIETNITRDMDVKFSEKDAKKLFYDGVKNISVVLLGNKPNQNGGTNDEWNLRWEFMLIFKKGNVLCTGYNDPAISYDFTVGQTQINNPNTGAGRRSYFLRPSLLDHRTLIPGAPVG
jgi:hypothetical protein